ncbi:MAG TPA: DUF1501 domain-containing protein, partial [Pirellulaceae bacterium]|nr:DUF1501 domain-containing protein [Pirellulaceae bacterium]
MLSSRSPNRTPAHINRRTVLRVGALGLGGLTIDQMLRMQPAQGASRGKAKGAILFWMAGGPSHIDMYDMKPHATSEVRGPFEPIETNLPGLLVNQHMPQHARSRTNSTSFDPS